eukprot:1397546-Rhodomonas_salina.1
MKSTETKKLDENWEFRLSSPFIVGIGLMDPPPTHDVGKSSERTSSTTCTPQKQIQETAFPVQIVPGTRFLVFEFAVYTVQWQRCGWVGEQWVSDGHGHNTLCGTQTVQPTNSNARNRIFIVLEAQGLRLRLVITCTRCGHVHSHEALAPMPASGSTIGGPQYLLGSQPPAAA